MSFELSRKTGSVLSVTATDQNLEWLFYVVERDGRRLLIPGQPQLRDRRNLEIMRLQDEATAYATAEARRRNWID